LHFDAFKLNPEITPVLNQSDRLLKTMLLDFRNETAFTGWALKPIKVFLVG
jgi:hypothetical protein